MKKQYSTPKFYPVNPQQIAWDMLRNVTETDRKYLCLFRYSDVVEVELITTRVYNRLLKFGFFEKKSTEYVYLSSFWSANKQCMRYE